MAKGDDTIRVVVHFKGGRVTKVEMPLDRNIEVHVYDFDKKKWGENFTDKDPKGNACKAVTWGTGRDRKDQKYVANVFVNDNKVKKVQMVRGLLVVVKSYKTSISQEPFDTKEWTLT